MNTINKVSEHNKKTIIKLEHVKMSFKPIEEIRTFYIKNQNSDFSTEDACKDSVGTLTSNGVHINNTCNICQHGSYMFLMHDLPETSEENLKEIKKINPKTYKNTIKTLKDRSTAANKIIAFIQTPTINKYYISYVKTIKEEIGCEILDFTEDSTFLATILTFMSQTYLEVLLDPFITFLEFFAEKRSEIVKFKVLQSNGLKRKVEENKMIIKKQEELNIKINKEIAEKKGFKIDDSSVKNSGITLQKSNKNYSNIENEDEKEERIKDEKNEKKNTEMKKLKEKFRNVEGSEIVTIIFDIMEAYSNRKLDNKTFSDEECEKFHKFLANYSKTAGSNAEQKYFDIYNIMLYIKAVPIMMDTKAEGYKKYLSLKLIIGMKLLHSDEFEYDKYGIFAGLGGLVKCHYENEKKRAHNPDMFKSLTIMTEEVLHYKEHIEICQQIRIDLVNDNNIITEGGRQIYLLSYSHFKGIINERSRLELIIQVLLHELNYYGMDFKEKSEYYPLHFKFEHFPEIRLSCSENYTDDLSKYDTYAENIQVVEKYIMNFNKNRIIDEHMKSPFELKDEMKEEQNGIFKRIVEENSTQDWIRLIKDKKPLKMKMTETMLDDIMTFLFEKYARYILSNEEEYKKHRESSQYQKRKEFLDFEQIKYYINNKFEVKVNKGLSVLMIIELYKDLAKFILDRCASLSTPIRGQKYYMFITYNEIFKSLENIEYTFSDDPNQIQRTFLRIKERIPFPNAYYTKTFFQAEIEDEKGIKHKKPYINSTGRTNVDKQDIEKPMAERYIPLEGELLEETTSRLNKTLYDDLLDEIQNDVTKKLKYDNRFNLISRYNKRQDIVEELIINTENVYIVSSKFAFSQLIKKEEDLNGKSIFVIENNKKLVSKLVSIQNNILTAKKECKVYTYDEVKEIHKSEYYSKHYVIMKNLPSRIIGNISEYGYYVSEEEDLIDAVMRQYMEGCKKLTVGESTLMMFSNIYVPNCTNMKTANLFREITKRSLKIFKSFDIESKFMPYYILGFVPLHQVIFNELNFRNIEEECEDDIKIISNKPKKTKQVQLRDEPWYDCN